MGGTHSFPKTQFTNEKIVIVTGGNTGIGYETAKWTAMLGATVIIACRTESRANDAIKRMHEEFQEEKKKTEGLTDKLAVEFMQVDLLSLKSVMKFVEDFKSSGRKLHYLVCNAGIGPYPMTITEDGHEEIFQVNYLSQFLMTAHFLPIMMNSGSDCRIVLVSSSAHQMPSNFNLKNVQGLEYSKEDFPRMTIYGYSKLYQIMQMYSMNRRLKDTNVAVTSLHPGIVVTEFQRSFHQTNCIIRLLSCFICCCRCCVKSPIEGAETSINAVVNPKYSGTRDIYFVDSKPSTPTRLARNEKYHEQLWTYTLELLESYLTDEIKDYLEGKRKS